MTTRVEYGETRCSTSNNSQEELRAMSKAKMDELMARMDRVERLEAKNAQRVKDYDAQVDADPTAREIRRLNRTIKFILFILALPAILVFLARLWLSSLATQ